MVEKKKTIGPNFYKQRGVDGKIQRKDAQVFDFMPMILGEQFRTDKILSRQLFRDPPVSGTFFNEQSAYESLGLRYAGQGKLVPALECYKFALGSKVGFISLIASIQDNVLLSPEEISRLNLDSTLEKILVRKFPASTGKKIDLDGYSRWLDKLRTDYKLWHRLNLTERSLFPNCTHARQYAELELELGMWGNETICGAEYDVGQMKDSELMRRVRRLRPKEILDVKWLDKYMEDNAPVSSMER